METQVISDFKKTYIILLIGDGDYDNETNRDQCAGSSSAIGECGGRESGFA